MDFETYLSRNVRKRTFWRVHPAKIQISLRVRAVWSESSQGAFWITKDAKNLHADSEDFDLTAQMRRLIWVFVGRMLEGTLSNVPVYLKNYPVMSRLLAPTAAIYYLYNWRYTGFL